MLLWYVLLHCTVPCCFVLCVILWLSVIIGCRLLPWKDGEGFSVGGHVQSSWGTATVLVFYWYVKRHCGHRNSYQKEHSVWACLQFIGLVYSCGRKHGGIQTDMELKKKLRILYVVYKQQEERGTLGLTGNLEANASDTLPLTMLFFFLILSSATLIIKHLNFEGITTRYFVFKNIFLKDFSFTMLYFYYS